MTDAEVERVAKVMFKASNQWCVDKGYYSVTSWHQLPPEQQDLARHVARAAIKAIRKPGMTTRRSAAGPHRAD